MKAKAEDCSKEQTESVPGIESISSPVRHVSLSMNGCLHSEISKREDGSSAGMNADAVHGQENGDVTKSTSSLDKEVSFNENGLRFQIDSEASRINCEDRDRVNSIDVRENVENNNMDRTSSQPCSSDMDEIPSRDKAPICDAVSGEENVKMVEETSNFSISKDSRVANDYEMEDSENTNMADFESSSSVAAAGGSSPKCELFMHVSEIEGGNGAKRAEIADGSFQ
ncbi:hypothetical protein F3Y22_tig00116971pilonHSYRG01110 [Hibiscus syriacus]|uniref:Uncharacterized protein n=2 Tax=Hibiscus syriacus TaxID=106335 RepID=A0A6A2WT19_HIBSY|nr:hypothetical protein F3Y22_tig00116971pilonHSYRG01110 [Hibiscus syriacus]